jgi:dTDP-glucose 4,6-dehydratase
MKNMLVTGGCGFIGANFIRYLLKESDYNLIMKIFENYQIDSVCHFAAESHVDRSIVKPDAFIQTNIVGTFNLLESARSRLDHIIRFHHISTDEVYGSLGREGYFTETTRYRPNSPYSASKASSDHLVRAFHKTYDLPMTISNCSNNYGPYQFPEKLIPLIILNALEGKSLPVYGDGGNIRDWLYVRDHCTAIWKIMKQGKNGDTYNVGGGSEMENIKLVEMICDVLDEMDRFPDKRSRRDLITFVKDRPGHDRRYAIDFGKLSRELKWFPEASLETGIRDTIKWYMENQKWVERVKSGEYQTWIKTHYC